LVIIGALASPAQAASSSPDRTPTFNGSVRAIAYAGSVAYVAGDFSAATVAGTSYPRNRVASFDVTTGALLPLNPGADALVRGLAVYGTTVFAVGDFLTFGGLPRHHLAAFDAATGAVRSTFAQWINGTPYVAATGNGRLYLGGTITAVDGVSRSRLAAISLATGALDTAWAPVADGRVEAIVPTPTRVYVGGAFSNINGGRKTQKLAALNPATGTPDLTFQSSVTALVHAIALTSNALYVAVGGRGGYGIRVDLTGKSLWTITTDGDIQAVVVTDQVYWGGHFDNVCHSANTLTNGVCLDGSTPRIKMAATDTNGVLSSWLANGNGVHGVWTLASNPALRRFAAGGDFTTINAVTQKRFVEFAY
jgi:hypothetical protein